MVIHDGIGWLGAKGKHYATVELARESLSLATAQAFHWEKAAPPDTPRKKLHSLKVFLSYAKEDKAIVREIYDRLSADGIDPWLDEEKILPGQFWESEISRAIRSVDSILVCFSKTATTKTGYLQKEIRLALDRAEQQPPGRIFLIPLRLEDCDVPESFHAIQWVNYFEPNGYRLLVAAFEGLAAWLNGANRGVLPPKSVSA